MSISAAPPLAPLEGVRGSSGSFISRWHRLSMGSAPRSLSISLVPTVLRQDLRGSLADEGSTFSTTPSRGVKKAKRSSKSKSRLDAVLSKPRDIMNYRAGSPLKRKKRQPARPFDPSKRVPRESDTEGQLEKYKCSLLDDSKLIKFKSDQRKRQASLTARRRSESEWVGREMRASVMTLGGVEGDLTPCETCGSRRESVSGRRDSALRPAPHIHEHGVKKEQMKTLDKGDIESISVNLGDSDKGKPVSPRERREAWLSSMRSQSKLEKRGPPMHSLIRSEKRKERKEEALRYYGGYATEEEVMSPRVSPRLMSGKFEKMGIHPSFPFPPPLSGRGLNSRTIGKMESFSTLNGSKPRKGRVFFCEGDLEEGGGEGGGARGGVELNRGEKERISTGKVNSKTCGKHRKSSSFSRSQGDRGGKRGRVMRRGKSLPSGSSSFPFSCDFHLGHPPGRMKLRKFSLPPLSSSEVYRHLPPSVKCAEKNLTPHAVLAEFIDDFLEQEKDKKKEICAHKPEKDGKNSLKSAFSLFGNSSLWAPFLSRAFDPHVEGGEGVGRFKPRPRNSFRLGGVRGGLAGGRGMVGFKGKVGGGRGVGKDESAYAPSSPSSSSILSNPPHLLPPLRASFPDLPPF